MPDYKEGLNPEQLAAATSTASHIIVVAGAGKRILAITFRRKAAFSTLILSSAAHIL